MMDVTSEKMVKPSELSCHGNMGTYHDVLSYCELFLGTLIGTLGVFETCLI